tara:strand:- start:1181 stop:1612 length:432 start_codon:yes stop_codon:yes gene_type:complete
MKLYIKNLTINNIIKNDKLHIKYNNFNKIYSKEGIFIIENNSIIRLNFYEDQSPITYYKYINNYDVICDKTKTSKEKVFQIPSNHYFSKCVEHTIQLSSKSIVSLIIVFSNNKINDYYFITNETDINNQFIKDEINELISYIN